MVLFQNMNTPATPSVSTSPQQIGQSVDAATAVDDTPEIPIHPVLVIAPKTVLGKWKQDICHWLRCDSKHVYIRHGKKKLDVSPSTWFVLTTFATARNDVSWFNQKHFKGVIVDECQALKNPQSAVTKTLTTLVRSCPIRMLLSGEPMNVPMHLPSYLAMVRPDLGPLANSRSFQVRYCLGTPTWVRNRYRWKFYGAQRTTELSRLLRDHVLFRRTKEEVLQACSTGPRDLPVVQSPGTSESSGSLTPEEVRSGPVIKPPSRRVVWVYVRGTKGDTLETRAREYSDECQRIKQRDKDWARERREKLLEIIEDPDLVDTDERKKQAMFLEFKRRVGATKTTVCSGWIHSYLLEIFKKREKVVIFAEHRVVLNALISIGCETIRGMLETDTQKTIHSPANTCLSKGPNEGPNERPSTDPLSWFVRIDGASGSLRERTLLVDCFQSNPDCRIAVVSIEAGGAGIELTAANHILFTELPFNADQIKQAEARVVRMGQTKPVNISYLVIKDSVEGDVWAIIQQKLYYMKKVMDAGSDAYKFTYDEDEYIAQ
jgi:SNF2 family DNA or RNA helicase